MLCVSISSATSSGPAAYVKTLVDTLYDHTSACISYPLTLATARLPSVNLPAERLAQDRRARLHKHMRWNVSVYRPHYPVHRMTYCYVVRRRTITSSRTPIEPPVSSAGSQAAIRILECGGIGGRVQLLVGSSSVTSLQAITRMGGVCQVARCRIADKRGSVLTVESFKRGVIVTIWLRKGLSVPICSNLHAQLESVPITLR